MAKEGLGIEYIERVQKKNKKKKRGFDALLLSGFCGRFSH